MRYALLNFSAVIVNIIILSYFKPKVHFLFEEEKNCSGNLKSVNGNIILKC